ncbi:MAG TPA: SLBB domain-containing protein [bacterium]|nr:SLBB domain-containing protein [bacterium]HPQ65462.1 SLBB domain-containing protein [bacterium]
MREAGVVGAGGAGFPTHVKVAARAAVVIANGAECEPLLKVDQQLMAARPGDLVQGLVLLKEAVGARKAVVALKQKYRQAVSALREEIARRKLPVDLHLMGSYYPAGDEQVLVREVTGKVVPEGGIPLDVGAVVSNVGTIINIARASRGIPVTTRTLTVAGEVREPVTLEVPVGAYVEDVLAAAGGVSCPDYRVIDGGPVMGAISGPSVKKTTTGLIVLPAVHKLIEARTRPVEVDVARAGRACDQCRYCTDYCPRYLLGHRIEPHVIMRLVGQQQWENIPAEDLERAWFCCQCGLCGLYACPTSLSPARVIAGLLEAMKAAGFKKPPVAPPSEPHPWGWGRKVPVSRLAARIDVARYERPALLRDGALKLKRVRLACKQHAGAPAVPVVAEGDTVSAGDVVAEPPAAALGARVHASIAGRIVSVTDQAIVIHAPEEES